MLLGGNINEVREDTVKTLQIRPDLWFYFRVNFL